MRFLVIFDGDDTLWECGVHYIATNQECAAIVLSDLKTLPLTSDEVINFERGIQRVMLKRVGMSLEYYTCCWHEGYRQLAYQCGVQPKLEVMEQLRQTTTGVYSQPFRVYPGVHEVLDELVRDGHELHLLTLGVDSLQRRKVADNGLDRFFSDQLGIIHVVSQSKGYKMKQLSQKHLPTIMIGDSEHSDIDPAVAIGLSAVLIVSDDPWSKGHKPRHPHVPVHASIHKIPQLLRQLAQSK